MKNRLYFILPLILLMVSCSEDLNVLPIDPDKTTTDKAYKTEDDFLMGLSKIYAGYAITGQKGPDGDADIQGIDEGASQYWRGYFVCQELPTDEVVNGWNDGNLPDMSRVTWTASNEFISAFYSRVTYQIALANEFIRQANEFGDPSFKNLNRFIAEAKFLRALSYWHAMDLFGNGVPFTTENDVLGTIPEPAGKGPQGDELFTYIENELNDIINGTSGYELAEPGQSFIGAANKGAAWMLQAKLYLNHKTYLGTEDVELYRKGRDAVNKVINEGGYSLATNYAHLFLADNHKMDNELIFVISQDGISMKNWGGTTYILNAAIGGNMEAADYGTTGNWAGNRVTKNLVRKFTGGDKRAMWFIDGQQLEIEQQDEFTHGYACVKYKNLTQDGAPGSNAKGGFPDIDIPVFRLGDAYLMQCEFDLRIDNALSAQALANLTELRQRAGRPTNVSEVDLNFILDERARELYWECHRRTDLVRYGLFTSAEYVWPFKGNDVDGIAVHEKYNWFPIPYSDLVANPKLEQNNPDY